MGRFDRHTFRRGSPIPARSLQSHEDRLKGGRLSVAPPLELIPVPSGTLLTCDVPSPRLVVVKITGDEDDGYYPAVLQRTTDAGETWVDGKECLVKVL